MSEKCNRELGDFYFSVLLKWQTWVIPLSDQKFTVQGPWERQQALTDSTVGST